MGPPNNHHAPVCFIFLIIILLRLDLLHGFTGITTPIRQPTHNVRYNNARSCLLRSAIYSQSDNNNNNKILWKLKDKVIQQQRPDGQQKPNHQVSSSPTSTILIHWKGEGTEGSTLQFRHVEFQGALHAVLLDHHYSREANDYHISFSNALQYTGEAEMPIHKRIRYNSAMQYLHLKNAHAAADDDTSEQTSRIIPLELLIQAAERCSLIHAMYQIVATVPSHESYEQLSKRAIQLGFLQSMYRGNVEEHATWCLRVRRYYGNDDVGHATIQNSDNNDENGYRSRQRAEAPDNNKKRKREKRHGERTRSLSLERLALQALEPLLLTFGGGVDLQNPDCKLYILDGLIQQQRPQPLLLLLNNGDDDDGYRKNDNEQQDQQQVKILTRRIAIGPRVSIMAPATRICITNTPLCPMAAFWMCNIAGIRPGQSILDPFAGSCAILLAAAMIHSSCRTVGIEIAHDGLVNRNDIRHDFVMRNLTLPCDLVHGDCTDVRIRRRAKRALLLRNVRHDDDDDDNDAATLPSFDYIITDPPYGIRESTNYNSKTPIQELFQAIVHDRLAAGCHKNETPLLKPGTGKLVCFVPVSSGEDLFDILPSQDEQDRAGLVLQKEIMQEQPLNDNLSRWLVCFHSV